MRGVLNLKRLEISVRLNFLLVYMKKVSTGGKNMLLRMFHKSILLKNSVYKHMCWDKWRLYENGN